MARLVIAVALGAGMAGAAEAQTVRAEEPQTVLSALRAYGHKAQLEQDEEGFPLIRVDRDGIRYTVHFYGCAEERAGCRDLQFRTSFDVDPGFDAAWANDWNRQWVAGRVDVNAEGDPFLSYFVTTAGGLSPATFRGVMDIWSSTLDGLMEDINW